MSRLLLEVAAELGRWMSLLRFLSREGGKKMTKNFLTFFGAVANFEITSLGILKKKSKQHICIFVYVFM